MKKTLALVLAAVMLLSLLSACKSSADETPTVDPAETEQTTTHISLAGHDVGLYKDSVVLLEQIRTIDKRRLREHMGHADESVMNQVDSAIAVSFGLTGI